MNERDALEHFLDEVTPFDWSNDELHTLLTIGQRPLTSVQAQRVAEAYGEMLPADWLEGKQREYDRAREEAQELGLEPVNETASSIMTLRGSAWTDRYVPRTEPSKP